MKKIFLATILFMAANLFNISAALAADEAKGVPLLFYVIVKEFALCKNVACTGADKVVLGSSMMELDITSLNAGTEVANYIEPDTIIPIGTYTHFRLVVSNKIRMMGIMDIALVGNQIASCKTNGSNPLTSGDINGDGTTDGSDAQLIGLVIEGSYNDWTSTDLSTFTLPEVDIDDNGHNLTVSNSEMVLLLAFSEPQTLEEGDVIPELRFDFSVNEGIEAWMTGANSCRIALGVPNISVKIGGTEILNVNPSVVPQNSN